MPKNHFSRKERQLKNHIYNLENLLKISNGIISKEINILISKIKNLVSLLKGNISINKLKHIIGSFAILFGLSTTNHINAQSFTTPVQNPFGLNSNSNIFGYSYYPGKAQFADMDGDGDLDLLYETQEIDTSYYSYYSDNIFIYCENIGSATNPQFSLGVKNPFNLTSPQNMTLAISLLSHNLVDLDNDGDFDILATYMGAYASYNYQTYQYEYSVNTVFKYYENIGNPSIPLFAAQQNNPFGLGLDSIIATSDVVDIDGDGDYDVICSSSVFGNQGYLQNQDMIYLENIGDQNNPQFSSPQVNLIGITFPNGYYPVVPSFGDLDQDGDFDLLTTPYGDFGNSEYKFLYQQNKGSATNPIMSLQAQNPFGLSPDTSYLGIIINSEMIDIDGDGDLDIISSGLEGEMFMYFENNSGSTSIDELSQSINIYPNPAAELLNIQTDYNIDRIEITDQLGRIVLKTDYYKKLNINNLNRGTYTLTLYSEDKVTSKSFSKL
ncbi:MAG: FG-GAP-like repeat-containing protein [Flavobacteriales bacterium]|nr:FG-GAP-like repeat-containing protein [Flavobacteriales bacterium]